MNLADFKRWHWALLGLIVGLAFGGIRYYSGSDTQTYNTVVRTLNNQREFEWGLSRQVTLESGPRPMITDVVVYPPVDVVVRDAKGQHIVQRHPVVFYQAVPTREPFDPANPDGPRKCNLTRILLEAKIPYVSQDGPADAGPNFTVLDYLAHVKSRGGDGPAISYKYAWWWEPRWNFTICALGGLVLIGGLWPTALNVLMGAGWGPKPSPKPAMDMSRYGKRGKAAAATGPAGPTDADRAQLAALEASLMAKVGDFGANAPTRSVDEEEAEHAAKIKELNSAPLEPTVAVGAKSDEPKHYEGAFYPVAKPVVKKKD